MAELIKQEFQDGIKSKLGDAVLDVQMLDMLTITVKRDAIFNVIKCLKEESEFNFMYLTSMCGMHFATSPNEQLGMVYMLHNLEKNWRVRIKIYFPINDPNVQTITPLFSAANWMEREAFDFFGIVFKGHPNLKRILNMEDITFYPMRKDFPLEDPNRKDKNDSMFGR
jgi:NADH-quinone oxidoreductase subunit C